MSLTIVTNDTLAAKLTGMNRREHKEMGDGVDGTIKLYSDEKGVVAIVGRGETDTLITYLALINTNSQTVYIRPNADGNGLIVNTTKP